MAEKAPRAVRGGEDRTGKRDELDGAGALNGLGEPGASEGEHEDSGSGGRLVTEPDQMRSDIRWLVERLKRAERRSDKLERQVRHLRRQVKRRKGRR